MLAEATISRPAFPNFSPEAVNEIRALNGNDPGNVTSTLELMQSFVLQKGLIDP